MPTTPKPIEVKIAPKIVERYEAAAGRLVHAKTAERMVARMAEDPTKFKEGLKVSMEPEITREAIAETLGQMRPGSPEKTAATTSANRIADVLDGKALAPAEQQIVRKTVYHRLNKHPLFADRLRLGLTDPNVQRELDEIMADPRYEKFLREEFGAALEFKIDAEYQAQEEAKTLADLKQRKQQEKVDNLGSQLTTVDNQLKDYDRTNVDRAHWGTKAQETERLQGSKAQDQSQSDRINAELQAAKDEQARLLQNIADINQGTGKYKGAKTITELQAEVNQLQHTISQKHIGLQPFKQRLDRLQQLETEESERTSKKDTLTTEKDAAEIALEERKNEAAAATREYSKAVSRLNSQERQLKEGFDGVIGKATAEWANEKVENLVDALYQELDAATEAAKSKHSEIVLRQMQKRFFKTEEVPEGWFGGRKRTITTVREAEVGTQFRMLKEEGLDGFITNTLRSEINPATGQQYTDEDIVLLLRDKTFIDEVTPRIVTSLIVAREASAGFTGADVAKLIPVVGEQRLLEGYKVSRQFREAVNQEAEKGGFANKSEAEKTQRAISGNPWLMLLLMGASTGVISAVTATQEEK